MRDSEYNANLSDHICRPPQGCICSISALEPADDCPMHGYPWPPRCADCGRFMAWLKVDQAA